MHPLDRRLWERGRVAVTCDTPDLMTSLAGAKEQLRGDVSWYVVGKFELTPGALEDRLQVGIATALRQILRRK